MKTRDNLIFVDRLNSNLPSQIRIFGYKRVTASFSAKKFCDRRRYVYLIPVFALDPCCHRDRETVLASLGSENELVKCLECSERGRKVEGLVGNSKRNLELEAMDVETTDKGDDNRSNKESINDNEGKVSVEDVNSKTSFETVVSGQDEVSPLNGGSENNSAVLEEEKVNGEDTPAKRSEFCYGEKERERFNKILKSYVGTHNFHNFTTRIKPEDPSAKRFIISFDASNTVG
ncbi:tRNA pseudouridine synthase 1-like [Cicer arietinum]|uniref:tRNA pseudouridine synthase 1-like n=1 Tax=Cicer arietinum TaxID=3827 RepID=UPI00032A53F8